MSSGITAAILFAAKTKKFADLSARRGEGKTKNYLNEERRGKIMKELFINPRKEIKNMYESLKQWDKGRKTGHKYDTSWRMKIGYDHWITIGMTYHEADGNNDAYVDGDVYFISRRERIKPCPADEAVDVFTQEAIRIYNEQLARKKEGKIYF